MKKLLVCFAVLVLLLVPAMAMAECDPLPPCSDDGEVGTWYKDTGGNWQYVAPGTASALARCWKTQGESKGECNQFEHEFTFTHHASMAQWCKWKISNTRWDWRILKPGTYGADCITIFLQSNDAIQMVYQGFDDLYREDGEETNRYIETSYAILAFDPESGNVPRIPDEGWISADEMDDLDVLFDDSMELHAGLYWKLFNMITVVNCNSAGEYENQGTITIKLTNLKPWVNPDGSWKEPQPLF